MFSDISGSHSDQPSTTSSFRLGVCNVETTYHRSSVPQHSTYPDGPGITAAAVSIPPRGVSASPACDTRVNNTLDKLLECVTLDGVRVHQAAFQAIADANNGIRTSGTPGYDASVDYVAGLLTDLRIQRDRSALRFPNLYHALASTPGPAFAGSCRSNPEQYPLIFRQR